ncbi:Transcription termination factor Rho [Bienertia sinuspersici]
MANSSEAVPLQELNQSELLVCITPPPSQYQEKNDVQKFNLISENNLENEKDVENKSYHGDSVCKRKVSAGLCTPDRLKLPKPFKFSERYTSPTDNMMSPITKGILARKNKIGALLPPSITQSKAQELKSSHIEQLQLDKEQ